MNPALKQTLGKLVSSDGHTIHEIGTNWMCIPQIEFNYDRIDVNSLKQKIVVATNQYLSARDYRVGPEVEGFGPNLTGSMVHILQKALITPFEIMGIHVGSP